MRRRMSPDRYSPLPLLPGTLLRTALRSALVLGAGVALGLAQGCLHERTPAQLRGEIERRGSHFVVSECSTGRTYELQLIPAAYVALDRHVLRVEEETDGPVLVELGGKALPATPATAADAVFDVHERYAVRAGACD